MLSVTFINCYAEFHNAERCYAECHYVEYRSASKKELWLMNYSCKCFVVEVLRYFSLLKSLYACRIQILLGDREKEDFLNCPNNVC